MNRFVSRQSNFEKRYHLDKYNVVHNGEIVGSFERHVPMRKAK